MMEIKNKEPRVSVIMPAYNAGKQIAASIESVIAQTFKDWQLLVIDDGSTDDTPVIIRDYEKRDSRIVLVPAEKNAGPARARNRGFQLSRGQYVALLDSDDLWYPEKLEQQLALAEETGADILYCSYAMIREDGSKACEDFIVPATTDFEHMLVSSVISCSTAMLSRTVIEQNQFPENYYHEDYVFWLQLLRKGFLAAGTPQVLGAYRLMEGSRASNKLASAKRRWKIYREYLELPLVESLKYLSLYALAGLKKYKKC